MYSLQMFLLLLKTLSKVTKAETNGAKEIMKSMNQWTNTLSGKNGNFQLILTNKEYNTLSKLSTVSFRVKYRLPIIDSVVVEAGDTQALLESTIQNNIEVEMDSILQAQMKRAGSIIQLEYAHERGIYGEGVGVAILDTGIHPHPDFITGGNRIVAFHDVINGRKMPYDDNGHGTHVAGIIGGNGSESKGEYIGVAPKCNIISVKVLNHKGNGNVSDVLAGLQWVVDNKDLYNIRVVNISVGTSSTDSMDEDSALVRGVNAVWDAGIIVVVAAGNNGPKPKTISTPGISRKVITVGASDDDIAVELAGTKAKDYSGRGPTNACIKKPDVVAPGSNIISCNVSRNRSTFSLFNNRRDAPMYTVKSGTSMATPIVSGAIALLLSVYPYMTTQEVKIRIKNSAIDLGQPWSKQGWGLINIKELLR